MNGWLAQVWALFAATGVAGRNARAIKQALQARRTELLQQNLSPSQRAQCEVRGYFEVIGGDTGARYFIRPGYQMNVEELDCAGNRVRLLCFFPEGRLITTDIMLAQTIALELFETEALEVANKTPTDGSRLGQSRVFQ